MSRLGAPIPFPQNMVGTGGGAIALGPGGVWYFPQGNYIVAPGQNVIIQWLDPNTLIWRSPNTPYTQSFNYVSSDGSNYRLLNSGSTITDASVTAAGSGATDGIGALATGVTISLPTPSGGIAAILEPIVGGFVTAPQVAQPGSRFLVPPVILADQPPVGGIQATATATIDGTGGVATVTLVNAGAGYQSPPNWYVIPQPPYTQVTPVGSRPAAQVPAPGLVYPDNLPIGSRFEGNKDPNGCKLVSQPNTRSGQLTGIIVISGGAGYSGTPTATITGATGATAMITVGPQPGSAQTSYVQQAVA